MMKKKKPRRPKIYSIVDPNIRSNPNDPYVIKKAAEAAAILRRVGLPEGLGNLDD
jgi:hypothetical protein